MFSYSKNHFFTLVQWLIIHASACMLIRRLLLGLQIVLTGMNEYYKLQGCEENDVRLKNKSCTLCASRNC